MTIGEALHKGGMRIGHATALAKHRNATIDQVCGGIRKCELKEAEGQKVNREALITAHVKNKWANPEPDHARDMAELPEHEQDVVGPLIEQERAEHIGHAGAGEAATMTAATTLAPVHNARLAALANDLIAASPNAQQDAEAAKKAADASRQKMLLAGRREEETFALNRRKLAALGPEMLDKLAAAAIAAAPNKFTSDRFTASRSAPLENRLMVMAMVQILIGGQQ